MSKYIIKNCPAKYYAGATNMKCSELGGDCDTKTDCIMKQIVERCRKEQEYHKEWQKETGFNYAATGLRLANEILQLLDIQEVG